MTTNHIEVRAIPILQDNYIWIIINKDTHQCVAIDPGQSAPLLEYLQQHKLTLDEVLITHHHHDHTDGLDQLHSYWPHLKVYGPKLESIQGVTHQVDDLQQLKLASISTVFTIMLTPGHTPGHVCYYAQQLGIERNIKQGAPWLFCGDTLFSGGCGRLLGGTAAQLYASLQRIAALPKNTFVCCTHEYTLANLRFAQQVDPSNQSVKDHMQKVQRLRNNGQMSLPSTLDVELEINPFLRSEAPELITAASQFAGKMLQAGLETFTALRSWKNNN